MPAAALEAIVVPLRPRRTPIPVSAAQLAAGREAFVRGRRQLDDLFDPYPSDRDAFIKRIFRAMRAAGD